MPYIIPFVKDPARAVKRICQAHFIAVADETLIELPGIATLVVMMYAMQREGEKGSRWLLTLRNWWEEILNYFIERITNGFVEALNGVLRAIMRIAFGYRNLHNFRLRAFAEFGTFHADFDGPVFFLPDPNSFPNGLRMG